MAKQKAGGSVPPPNLIPDSTLPRFGTDGWRAIIAEQFTFENVRRIAAATARFLRDEGKLDQPIAVGFDTRFLSKEFAQTFAETAAGCGALVYLSPRFCPTPMLSFAVRKLGCALGVMITASHNPYSYNGIKFKGPYGGPATVTITRRLEEYLHALGSAAMAQALGGRVIVKDFAPAYWRQIDRFVDTAVLARMRGKIVFDPMHGAGIASVDAFLAKYGLKVSSVRSEPNPLFDGGGPEPIAQNLSPLREAIRNERAVLGLATDGDADRFGVLDAHGEFVQLHDLMPLLFRHLIETRGWSGDVVRTTSMHDTIDRIAAAAGRQTVEVPVGFKNVCEQMLERDVLIGGEESGGFGYKNHLPERDGVLSCLLVVEMLARRRKSIADLVAELRRETGPFAYGRIDKHFPTHELRINFAELKSSPPKTLAGIAVERVSTVDGLKFYFRDGSWMLMRISDTEPLGRIYVGSHSQSVVERLLKAGAARLFKHTSSKP